MLLIIFLLIAATYDFWSYAQLIGISTMFFNAVIHQTKYSLIVYNVSCFILWLLTVKLLISDIFSDIRQPNGITIHHMLYQHQFSQRRFSFRVCVFRIRQIPNSVQCSVVVNPINSFQTNTRILRICQVFRWHFVTPWWGHKGAFTTLFFDISHNYSILD